MQDYKASYILTKSEMLFLLSSVPEKQSSFPAMYAIDQYLRESVPSQETVESLIGKKLARKAMGSISIEPVVDLLVKSALSAVSLWEIKCAESGVIAVIMRSDALFLLITQYKHIEGNWKITPFQDRGKLLGELDELRFNEVTQVDCGGTQNTIKPDKNYLWIEEDYNG